MIPRPIPWGALAWDAFCLACVVVIVVLIARDDRTAPRASPASFRAPECRPADQVWREVREHSDPRRRVG